MEILPAIAIALAAGVVPMLVYAYILGLFDRYEKEPIALLIAAFLWGAAPAILFSLGAQLLLAVPAAYFVEPAADLLAGAVVAPVTEEVFKGAAILLLLIFYRKEIDSPLDGIVYGGLVGFGFAAVENVLYFVVEASESGMGSVLTLVALRSFVFGLNHALFTGMTGLGLALARTSARRIAKYGAPLAGLLAAMTAHGIHNAGVMLGAEFVWPCAVALISDWGGVLVLLGIIIWASVRERRWIATWLADEVEQGTLGERQYRQVSSYTSRLSERSSALFSGNLRRWSHLGNYYRLATELAFAKRHLAECPSKIDTDERVASLRREVKQAWQELSSLGTGKQKGPPN